MDELQTRTLMVHEEGNLFYLSFPSFDRTGKVHHAFSTRRGGSSQGVYASMNLGLGSGDDIDNVLDNFYRMSTATGIYIGDMVLTDQVHSDRILYVDQQYRGSGLVRETVIEATDGLVTDKKRVALVTFHADCVPLFFLDPIREVIGLAHAGWRGTSKKIGAKMVRKMQQEFGCQPADILVGIGPSIGPCCYEVGSEVASVFQENFSKMHDHILTRGKDDRYYLDLWEANVIALTSVGVLHEHITVTDLCTRCHPEYFHSHRRTGKPRGTQAAFLELV